MMSRTDVRGVQDRRGPSPSPGFRPFSAGERREIAALATFGLPQLYEALTTHQANPRSQRVIQEAIEINRANG